MLFILINSADVIVFNQKIANISIHSYNKRLSLGAKYISQAAYIYSILSPKIAGLPSRMMPTVTTPSFGKLATARPNSLML